jgi:hypothetical protein
MPRPAALQKWFDEHPDAKPGGRPPGPSKMFPRHGNAQEQRIWFRDEYLRLAAAEKDAQKKARLLDKAAKLLPKLQPVPVETTSDRDKYQANLAEMNESLAARVAKAKGGGQDG